FLQSLPKNLRQGENVNRVVFWCVEFRNLFRQFRDLGVIARHYGNELLSLDRISNGADRNVADERRLPKLLSGLGIEGFELLTHVAVENQSARGRQHRAVARSAADIEAQDFARCQ